MVNEGIRGRVLVPLALESDGALKLRRNFVRTSYVDALTRHGLVPLFVSPFFPAAMVDELYRLSGGLCLLGGDDIDADLYGEKNHPANALAPRERDLLEISLVKRAVADRLPVLGICRGCQVLAVANSGTLHQHVPDISSQEHRLARENFPGESLIDSLHPIQVRQGSTLERIVQKSTITVNSSHHQSVKTIGTDFVVSATSGDGIIEAVEHRDAGYFCLGLQCHPEARASEESDRIFSSFTEAVEREMRRRAEEGIGAA